MAFHTRMSATEQVMKRSEQSAGKMTSFTRAKWQVPRSSVSMSIVTQYLGARADTQHSSRSTTMLLLLLLLLLLLSSH